MTPNHKFTYNTRTEALSMERVDAEEYTSWIYGFLSFHSQSLGEVIPQLKRYFNVQIDYTPSQLDRTLVSGKLDLRLGIEETLNFIALTTPVTYRKSGDGYVITVKR